MILTSTTKCRPKLNPLLDKTYNAVTTREAISPHIFQFQMRRSPARRTRDFKFQILKSSACRPFRGIFVSAPLRFFTPRFSSDRRELCRHHDDGVPAPPTSKTPTITTGSFSQLQGISAPIIDHQKSKRTERDIIPK